MWSREGREVRVLVKFKDQIGVLNVSKESLYRVRL